MEKNDLKDIKSEVPINKAGNLWRLLTAPADLKNAFYDRDLLYGNQAVSGMYKVLGIEESEVDFADELDRHGITVEKLLTAFFQTLQPYAKMMSDMCVFFQKHAIDETDRSLIIEFDFSDAGTKLEFDLEHFRIQLDQYKTAQVEASYPVLGLSHLWALARLVIKDWRDLGYHDSIRDWLENYNKGIVEVIPFPTSGYPELDYQMERLHGIWASFITVASDASITPMNCEDFIQAIRSDNSGLKPFGWDLESTALAISDGWPRTFMNCIHFRVDIICRQTESEGAAQAEMLALEIKDFLDKYLRKNKDKKTLVEDLQDLLRLPFWNQRHALYSVWVFQLMDRLLVKFPDYKVNHNDGKLGIPFKAVKLACFSTIKGKVELWSEMRMPVEEPEGAGRKANIQPDYTFFNWDSEDSEPSAESAVVVVEVKQYKTPGSGFAAVMNDYIKGAFNAHIFLANYGSVRPKMRLKQPIHCTAIGQVLPDSEPSSNFLAELEKWLPTATFPLKYNSWLNWSENEWMLLHEHYDAIYIDISGSLDMQIYKDFLRIVLNWILSGNPIKKLTAVDTAVRGSWIFPSAPDVEQLIALPFEEITNFREYLKEKNILLITDASGASHVQDLEGTNITCIICFNTELATVEYIR